MSGNETKHTPGPWSYEDPSDATCGMPCTQDGCPDNHPTGWFVIDGPEWDMENNDAYGPCTRNEADARLIAAAPELLEALIEVMSEYSPLPTEWFNNTSVKATGRTTREAIAMARAAILKATSS